MSDLKTCIECEGEGFTFAEDGDTEIPCTNCGGTGCVFEDTTTDTWPTSPSTKLLCKLGLIAVHAEELLSPHGPYFNRAALDALTNDAEVRQWLEAMRRFALLPEKRNG